LANDISLAVGDGTRRMTYVELAQARGISLTSVRRLVLRHRWPRQVGKDGAVRVSVPLSALAKASIPRALGDITTDIASSRATDTTTAATDTVTASTDPVSVLRHAVELLEKQLAEKDRTIAFLHGRLDQLLTLFGERRPWWRRWFR
jgi:hypothetical protein